LALTPSVAATGGLTEAQFGRRRQPRARHGTRTAIVDIGSKFARVGFRGRTAHAATPRRAETHHAEVALETLIVTTAKRILKSVQVDACWRIAFADTFCYVRHHVDVRPPHEINEIEPNSVARTASIMPRSWPSQPG
jgi:hypothetical protein